MVDLALVELDVEIAHKQGHIGPVVVEPASSEHGIGTVHVGDEVELTIVEEITIVERDVLGIPQLHDAISTIVDIGTGDRQRTCLTSHDAIGAASIEVARNDRVVTTARHADDSTFAGSSLGMADGEVLHLTAGTIDEIETEGIACIDLDAGVVLSTNDEIAEVLQRELVTITTGFADDSWSTASTLCARRPNPTRNTCEQFSLIEYGGEVQVDIGSYFDHTIIAQSLEELLLGSDEDDLIDNGFSLLGNYLRLLGRVFYLLWLIGFLGNICYFLGLIMFVQEARFKVLGDISPRNHTIFVGQRFLTCNQFQIGLFNDTQLDTGVVA